MGAASEGFVWGLLVVGAKARGMHARSAAATEKLFHTASTAEKKLVAVCVGAVVVGVIGHFAVVAGAHDRSRRPFFTKGCR